MSQLCSRPGTAFHGCFLNKESTLLRTLTAQVAQLVSLRPFQSSVDPQPLPERYTPRNPTVAAAHVPAQLTLADLVDHDALVVKRGIHW